MNIMMYVVIQVAYLYTFIYSFILVRFLHPNINNLRLHILNESNILYFRL